MRIGGNNSFTFFVQGLPLDKTMSQEKKKSKRSKMSLSFTIFPLHRQNIFSYRMEALNVIMK